MRRVLAFPMFLAGVLAGCDAVEESRRAIEESCIANGESAEICACLARESAERLDPAVLELMVMGAKGEPRQASERARTLAPTLQTQLALDVPVIMAECGMPRS